MSPLRAVLFDLDGLLVDSEPLWFRVEERVMAELGGPPWRPEDQAACVGGTLPRTAAYLRLAAASPVPEEDIARRLVSGMVSGLRAGVPLRPGAEELLAELAAARVPCGLVSSSYRILVDAALAAVAPVRFAVSVAGDEVRRTKPHPEPYLTAARLLGVDPRDCVVLEDAPAGVDAAEAAGCICVAVPDLVPVEETPDRPVVASLAAVTVGWLAELAARRPPSARHRQGTRMVRPVGDLPAG